MTISRLCLSALLLGSVEAQTPSWTTFGNPCSSPLPLSALNLPRIGQVFQLQLLSSAAPPANAYEGFSVPVALLAGTSRTIWQGHPLPWTSGAMQGALRVWSVCGDLSVAPDFTLYLPFLYPQAMLTYSMQVPNSTSVLGTSVFFQTADYTFDRHGRMFLQLGVAGEARIGI